MRVSPVILVILIHSFMAIIESNFSTIDQAALLELKARITFDPQNILANWSTSTSPCNWIGVSCSSRHERVTALELPDMSLGGTIPPHIGNLSFLVSFNLSANNFQGYVPKELGQLRALRIIDLANNSLSGSLPDDICESITQLELLNISSNGITGQLPSSLGDCSKLKSLLLRENEFTGRIPQSIGNLSELMELHLDGNYLEGRIPKNIGNCSLLKRLYLGENHLTGELPNEIGNLKNLERLDIPDNNLTGVIPSMFFNISSIEVIQLQQNDFTGHLPSNIGLHLPNLRGIFLWGNNLSGTIPSSIYNSSKLKELQLSSNSFHGLIPNTFGHCGQLRRLYLGQNYFTTVSSHMQSFFSSLTNCRYLRYLVIEKNPLKGMLPTSIGNLSTSLEFVYAGACQLSGGIPEEIGNLSNLVVLSLYKNELSGFIPTTLGKLGNLQGLDLSSNKLHGSIPFDLCQLEKLHSLYLHNNKLHGPIPSCLGGLISLRYLYLDSNELNSTIPSTFWRLRHILQIDLSSNSLGGSLPLDIGSLEALNELNLSRNQLSGNIPSSLGDIKVLTSLSLARNGFEGPIPQSFGGLLSLETLDLAGNNLSGVIPKSLESLSYLKYFNVSYNELEGEIPTGGPFVNFSSTSFMSNHKLCGSPRLQVLTCKKRSLQRSKKFKTLFLRCILPAVLSITTLVALVIVSTKFRRREKCLPTQDNLFNLGRWRRISYHELRQLTNGFHESNLLGIGSFGSVYKGTLSDGMNVAIKVFNLHQDGALQSFDVECEVMSGVRHRNLLKIISSCSNSGFKAIIVEYMANGSLEKWLYSHSYFLDILQRLDVMINVASALEYLHHGYSTPIIHCDLKPSNILLDDDMVAHVGDFGISKLLDGVDSTKQTMTLATIGYMAPEYGTEGIVSTNGDVYSFGILLMETFTRKKPTDEMFVEEMTLKRLVEESFPHAVTEVVDADLLVREEDHFAARKDCISSILDLALKCSAEIPKERMNMKDTLVTLEKIKTIFLKEVEVQEIHRKRSH